MLVVDEEEPAKTHLQAGWWEHQPSHLPSLIVLVVPPRRVSSRMVVVVVLVMSDSGHVVTRVTR